MSAFPARGRARLAALLLTLAFTALTVTSARNTGATADERLLWRCGARAVAGDWTTIETCFQGPIGLYPNQSFARADAGPENGAAPGLQADFGPGELARARLGMLGFGLLCGWLVWTSARRLFGDGGGLLALAAFALHPLMWGYAGLVAVDMAHAALTLLALEAVLYHARAPSLRRAALAGAACALALATKYLFLLVLPVAALFVALHARRGARPGRLSTSGAAALASLAAFALAFLVALHASYGFLAGSGMAGEASSGAFERALAFPGGRAALALLPGPLLRGLDYQLAMGANAAGSFFAGEYRAGHPLYHVVGIAVKTPLAMLLAGALALVLGVPRWVARTAPRARRDAVLLFAAAAAVSLFYLSCLAKLQIGIRYVLPLFPLGCIALGGLAEIAAHRRLRRVARGALAGAFAAACLAPALVAWPNGIGYFNETIGGAENAHRLFVDSNADWGQRRESGLAALRGRHPDAFELGRASAPRLGRVAIYVRFRAPRDPEEPTRARHWLDAFEPLDHEGPAWLVYDATPQAWRAAADRDPRARAELALALLGAGRLAEAALETGKLPPARAAGPAGLLALARAARASPDDPVAAHALARGWLAVGGAEQALAALDSPALADRAADAAVGVDRAAAEVARGDLDAAIAALEAVRLAPDDRPDAMLLLAELYRRTLRLDDGIALLERELERVAPERRTPVAELLERLRTDRSRWNTFQERP
jgi:hypothetical protein